MSRPPHLAGLGIIGSPSWSSGGPPILFNSDRAGLLELYAENLEGWITHYEGNEFNGVWRPTSDP